MPAPHEPHKRKTSRKTRPNLHQHRCRPTRRRARDLRPAFAPGGRVQHCRAGVGLGAGDAEPPHVEVGGDRAGVEADAGHGSAVDSATSHSPGAALSYAESAWSGCFAAPSDEASAHDGYRMNVAYYLACAPDSEDYFGVPSPAVGVRVVFDAGRLVAAREGGLGDAVARELTGDEGLVVLEDPRERLTWPCRLWRVDNLEGAVRLLPSNGWLLCKAVTVREELPGWLVMGPRGDAVVQVVEQARGLTGAQASAIAALDEDDEGRLYQAVWDRWLRLRTGGSGSPLGKVGLYPVFHAVNQAARRTSPTLFGWDEADGVEVLTDPAWVQAQHAAMAAALALGAPDILDVEENERLARRWIRVMRRPGPPG